MSKPYYRWQPCEPFGLSPKRKEKHYNPLVGCDHGAKFGCLERCWAEPMVKHYGNSWRIGHDFRPRLVEEWLSKPLSWKKPCLVPTGFMGDIACLAGEDIGEIINIIRQTPQHLYLVLTKDPGRLAQKLKGRNLLPPNVWLLATVRDQSDADRVIPPLFNVPAAHYGLSMEPLLGPVDLRQVVIQRGDRLGITPQLAINPLRGTTSVDTQSAIWTGGECPKLSWIAIGCESGRGASWGEPNQCALPDGALCPYPCDPCNDEHPCPYREWEINEWTRSVLAQCRAASVPALLKQLPVFKGGKWVVSSDPADFPQDLRKE